MASTIAQAGAKKAGYERRSGTAGQVVLYEPSDTHYSSQSESVLNRLNAPEHTRAQQDFNRAI